jgi:TM2 domain-containing membrane protein YozV
MFIALVCVVVFYLFSRGVLRLFLPRATAGLVVLAAFATVFLYALCFISGLLFSALYEPHAYWASITLDGSFFDRYMNTLDGGHFYRLFLIPVYFVFQVFMWSCYILRTHFTWGFGVAYSCGAIIMYSWGRIVYLNRQLADARYGF